MESEGRSEEKQEKETLILIIKYLNTEKLELKKRLCFDNAKKEIEKNKKLWTREKIEIKNRLEGLIIGME